MNRHVHQRPRGFTRHNLEMKSLATHNASERDRSVVRPTGSLRGVQRDRHPGRDFQRAGDSHKVMRRAGGLQGARCAGQEIAGDRIVKARFDNEKAPALDAGRRCGGGPARLGHADHSLEAVWIAARP